MMPSQVRLFTIDMIKALHYCHRQIHVLHRDIKPDNIMLNHNNEAVLIDFGVSALVHETDHKLLDRNMGTYMLYAPEVFTTTATKSPSSAPPSKQQSGEMTDIWALGITVYYLLTGRYPCEDARDPISLRDMIIHRPINFDLVKNR